MSYFEMLKIVIFPVPRAPGWFCSLGDDDVPETLILESRKTTDFIKSSLEFLTLRTLKRPLRVISCCSVFDDLRLADEPFILLVEIKL